eukprot:SM000193S05186  [mRNA]  locus=s193:87165:90907:- [translate_table: standard]
MAAGADVSLQNEGGWTPLQEASILRDKETATIMLRHYQELAWAKWCRRLPCLAANLQRMRDFYLELHWKFESPVIPFIHRLVPSDTYRIWKCGASIRADMTLAGFDNLRVQRKDQTVLFFGSGSADGKLSPGTLCILDHTEREALNVLGDSSARASDADLAADVQDLFATNVYRAGIDVTAAELVPQLTWRRQEKVETVGPWKTKVYEMHNVQVTFKSRRVPGARPDKELFALNKDGEGAAMVDEDLDKVLTEEERQQLDAAFEVQTHMLDEHENADSDLDDSDGDGVTEGCDDDRRLRGITSAKGGMTGNNGVPSQQLNALSIADQGPSCTDNHHVGTGEKLGKNLRGSQRGWRSLHKGDSSAREEPLAPGKALQSDAETAPRQPSTSSKSSRRVKLRHTRRSRKGRAAAEDVRLDDDEAVASGGPPLSSFEKGLKPILWLTDGFPLKMDELVPLLDVLANKVKAVRRLKEVVTTKLPPGMVPVKVAIPIFKVIRAVVTFCNFQTFERTAADSNPPAAAAHEEFFEDGGSAGEDGDHDSDGEHDDLFVTPPGSPSHEHASSGRALLPAATAANGSPEANGTEKNSSWFAWRTSKKKPVGGAPPAVATVKDKAEPSTVPGAELFSIPPDYKWIDARDHRQRARGQQHARHKASAES